MGDRTAAARVRRYRARKAGRRAVLRVEVDTFAVADWLVDKGFLQQWDADDRDKVQEALQQALEAWSSYA